MTLNRRSRPRFALTIPWDGTLIALSDALVVSENGDLVALSDLPVIDGEVLTLDLIETSGRSTVRARVVRSRPVLTEGRLRHELQLALVDELSGR